MPYLISMLSTMHNDVFKDKAHSLQHLDVQMKNLQKNIDTDHDELFC